MQNDIQLQLEQMKTLWESIVSVPVDLTPNGYPGLTKQSIATAFGELAEIAANLATVDDFEPSTVSKNMLINHLTNIRMYVTTHIPQNPIPHIPALLSLIESVQSILFRWRDEVNGKELIAGKAEVNRPGF